MFLVSKKRFENVLGDLAIADNLNNKLNAENAELKKALDIAKSNVYKTPIGITEAERMDYRNALKEALEAAHKRQKSANAKPTEYMRGLEFAIKTLDEYPVHELI